MRQLKNNFINNALNRKEVKIMPTSLMRGDTSKFERSIIKVVTNNSVTYDELKSFAYKHGYASVKRKYVFAGIDVSSYSKKALSKQIQNLWKYLDHDSDNFKLLTRLSASKKTSNKYISSAAADRIAGILKKAEILNKVLIASHQKSRILDSTERKELAKKSGVNIAPGSNYNLTTQLVDIELNVENNPVRDIKQILADISSVEYNYNKYSEENLRMTTINDNDRIFNKLSLKSQEIGLSNINDTRFHNLFHSMVASDAYELVQLIEAAINAGLLNYETLGNIWSANETAFSTAFKYDPNDTSTASIDVDAIIDAISSAFKDANGRSIKEYNEWVDLIREYIDQEV